MMNQKGYAIVTALFIMLILMLTSTLAIYNSINEVTAAGNDVIHTASFYAADGGAVHSSIWLIDNYDKSNNPEWKGVISGGFPNLTSYKVEVTHWLDDDGNIVFYGDEDGDYLPERNSTTGRPYEVSISIGSHVRGSKVTIKTIWEPNPPFVMPEAALWVHSNVNGNGVSGAIVGEGPSDDSLLSKAYYDATYDCPAVPDIMYETVVHDIEYDGNTGEAYSEKQASGIYPLILALDNFRQLSDYYIDSISGNKLPADVDFSEERVVFIDAGNVKLSQKITGSGILINNGDLEVSGNLSWNGLILVNGHITMNGGGASNSTMVTGAIVAVGDAVAINGSVDIIYNCQILNSLYNKYYSYNKIAWLEEF
jgi:hypothetical protein